jgi:hypothetical protein
MNSLDRTKLAQVAQQAIREIPDAHVQPGYAGKDYRPGGLLVLGKNPAEPRGEEAQFELIERLRGDIEAFEPLMDHLAGFMRGWSITGAYLLRRDRQGLLDRAGLDLADIAFLNLVKSPETKRLVSRARRDWQYTADQIRLLQPGVIVVLGKGTRDLLSVVDASIANSDRTLLITRTNGDHGPADWEEFARAGDQVKLRLG